MHHSSGTNNVEITKEMIVYSKNSYTKYNAYLEEQKGLEEEKLNEAKRIAAEKENIQKEQEEEIDYDKH